MKRIASSLRRCLGSLSAAVFCTAAAMAVAHAQDASSLRSRHTDLHEKLSGNQFQRPLYLESSETPGTLKGDVYAVIEQPYARVGPALRSMDHWCDILILHLNVKSCRASAMPASDTLSLHIGRKYDQPLTDSYQVDFAYQVPTSGVDYQQIVLNAEEGPLGTSDYRIVLEVAALDAGRSFVHLSYSYAYGVVARVAMQGYLLTTGRDKLGFSIIGRKSVGGQPIYIGGTRGVVERNTMRYYLAVEAYLGALSTPAPAQLEKRLNDWYSGVERYPIQLHELEREEYLTMKRREVLRQLASR